MKSRPNCRAVVLVLFLPLVAAGQTPERAPAPAKEKRVVEEIIARVNSEIITLSELRRARESLLQEVQEDCRGCTPAQVEAQMTEREKNLLRDLIDQSLLVQRGKDRGFNVEPDVVKRAFDICQRNNFPDLDTCQKRIEEQGASWEDFKNNIRNNLLTQEVIRQEVGRSIIIDKEEVQKYYDEHKNEFNRPEMVFLSEIFVSTDGKPEADVPALEAKAKKLLDRVKNGEDFEELAKRYSDSETSKQGGNLGGFQRGQLAKEIEDVVFKMKAKELSDVIRTKTGFLVLRVDQRYEAGLQPVEKVEPEIQNRLYYDKMQPGMRKYLTKLREESFVVVKPGYTDSAAVISSPIVEVEPTLEEGKKKTKKPKKAEETSKEKKAEANNPKKGGE